MTVLKTVGIIGYFWYVVYNLDLVHQSVLAGEKEFKDVPFKIQVLQLTLIAFGLQHFIFIIGRLVFFLFIQTFCCGCPCIDGNATELGNQEDPFSNRIVSMNYEKYTIEQR